MCCASRQKLASIRGINLLPDASSLRAEGQRLQSPLADIVLGYIALIWAYGSSILHSRRGSD